jgi:hypothetical protein
MGDWRCSERASTIEGDLAARAQVEDQAHSDLVTQPLEIAAGQAVQRIASIEAAAPHTAAVHRLPAAEVAPVDDSFQLERPPPAAPAHTTPA